MRKIQSHCGAISNTLECPTVSTPPPSDPVAQALTAMSRQPAVRMDCVNALRRQLAQGYHPTAEQIADAILTRADHLRANR